MIYIVVLVFLCISSYYCDFANKRGYVKLFLILSLFILTMLSGLSYEIGSDIIAYMEEYDSAPDLSSLQVSDFYALNRQPGWIVLEAFFKTCSSDFSFFKFFQAVILNLSVWLFLKRNSPYPATCLLVYYVSAYFPLNFETMRESFAISIFLFYFNFLKEKKYFKYYLLCLCSLMFHISALILFVLPIFGMIKVKRQHLMMLLPIFVILILLSSVVSLNYSFLNIIFSERIAFNAESYLGNAGAAISIVFILVFCLRYYIISRNLHKFQVDNIVVVLFLFSILLGIFTRSVPILYRFQRYINFTDIVCFSGALVTMLNTRPDIMFRTSKSAKPAAPRKKTLIFSKGIRLISMLVVLFLFSFSGIKGYFATNQKTGIKQVEYYYPYKSIFNK